MILQVPVLLEKLRRSILYVMLDVPVVQTKSQGRGEVVVDLPGVHENLLLLHAIRVSPPSGRDFAALGLVHPSSCSWLRLCGGSENKGLKWGNLQVICCSQNVTTLSLYWYVLQHSRSAIGASLKVKSSLCSCIVACTRVPVPHVQYLPPGCSSVQ